LTTQYLTPIRWEQLPKNFPIPSLLSGKDTIFLQSTSCCDRKYCLHFKPLLFFTFEQEGKTGLVWVSW
jgi:hypothetical protein